MARETVNGRNLQKSVVPLARLLGWSKVAWFPPVKTSTGWRVGVGGDAKGWPDLVMVRDRLLIVEIKGDTDRFRGFEQQEWLAALRMIGSPDIEAVVWTPADWHDGTIERALRRRGPAPPPEPRDTQLGLNVLT